MTDEFWEKGLKRLEELTKGLGNPFEKKHTFDE